LEDNNAITVGEVLAVKKLKDGKAADCDEIQIEMLKALNREAVLSVTCVCQMA